MSERIVSFSALADPDAFARALALRMAVFVHEQHVPAENERDALDETATHWLLLEGETGEPLATARSFPYGAGSVKIGRMAVSTTRRGEGLGRRLLEAVLRYAETCQPPFQQAVLDAQVHALGFYEGLGFVAEGEVFLDEGIAHRRMRKGLSQE